MKSLLRCLCLLLAMAVGSLMAVGWTATGLSLLARVIGPLSGGMIRIGDTRGALLFSCELRNVAVDVPGMELRIGRIGLGWQPNQPAAGRLHLARLAMAGVEIRLLDSQATEAQDDSSAATVLPTLVLPLAVLVDKLTVDDLRLLGGNYAELTRVDHFSVGLAADGSRLELHDLVLRAPGYEGDLQGAVDFTRGWEIQLAGRVVYRDYGTGPFAGQVRISGPLAGLDVAVDLQQPARGRVKGQILELPDNFKWVADLELFEVQLADGHEILPELLFTVAGKAEGEMLSYGGTLTGRLDYLFFKDVDVTIEVHGNEDQIEFPRIEAASPDGRAVLTDGLLSWKDELLWRAHLATDSFDPACVLPEYPGAIDLVLDSSGQYSEKNGLRLKANFSNFSGQLRGYNLAAQGRMESDRSSVRIEGLRLRSGEAVLEFDGKAENSAGLTEWQRELSWQSSLKLADFDPALFFPGYDGRLNAAIASEGTIERGRVAGRVDIAEMKGRVRGYPVSGRGKIHLADERLVVDDLHLQSGNSALHAQGSGGDTMDVAVTLESGDLGELLAGASGTLKVEASVTGKRQAPAIELKAAASKLGFSGLAANRLSGEMRGAFAHDVPLNVSIHGEGLQLGGLALTTAEVGLSGVAQRHEVMLKTSLPDGRLSLRGSGELQEDLQWHGKIQDLLVDHAMTGRWQQRGSSVVKASAAEVDVAPLCLGAGGESICLGGAWHGQPTDWQADLKWQDLDLTRLNPLLRQAMPLKGRSSAKLSATGNGERLTDLAGTISLSEASLIQPEAGSEIPAIILTKAQARLGMTGQRLKSELNASLSDGSNLEVAADIAGFGDYARPLRDLPLGGRVRANLKDLSFVAPLTRYYVRPTGMLLADLQLAGTVAAPVATGRLTLSDGQLEMPSLGVTLKEVLVNLTGKQDGIAIDATAASGPGNIKADGILQLGAGGVKGDFQFTGKDFDTAKLPEYELRTSPDLKMVFDQHGGKLTGRVEIPKAVIAPERMTASVPVSEDVVYLDGNGEENGGGWQFATSLELLLGDDVRLDGYGISGYLRGDLQVDKVPGSAMRGRGQLSLVDGVFSIYGRNMTIERSRLLFAGGPVDNPGVDVRAKKVVADNRRPNETIEVGVEISGTADNLNFSLFSNPPLEESDILAYMVVGRSRSEVGKQDESLISSAAMALGMDRRLGPFGELTELLPVDEIFIEGDRTDEMSLVVGKQLTDDLFIGYGHNFFEQEGEVRIRYSLGRGFSIETRSSGEKTGADLLYSFER